MPISIEQIDKQTQQTREANDREAAKLDAEMPGRVEFVERFSQATPEQKLAMWDKAVEYQVISSNAEDLAQYSKAARRNMSFIDRIEAEQKAKGQTLAALSPQQQVRERKHEQDNGLGDE